MADYGISRVVGGGDDTQGVFSDGLHGTPGYVAPETASAYRYSVKVGA